MGGGPFERRCKLCKVSLTSASQILPHVSGKKHKKNLKKKSPKTLGLLCRLQYIADTHMDKDPVLGLEHVLEVPEGSSYSYTCLMCHFRGDLNLMFNHILEVEHRVRYIRLHHPDMFIQQDKYTANSEYARTVQETGAEIEELYGRKKLVEKEAGFDCTPLLFPKDDAAASALVVAMAKSVTAKPSTSKERPEERKEVQNNNCRGSREQSPHKPAKERSRERSPQRFSRRSARDRARNRRSISREKSLSDIRRSKGRARRSVSGSASKERSPEVRHRRGRARRSTSKERSPVDVRRHRGRERRLRSRERSPLDARHPRKRERRSSSREKSPLDVRNPRGRARRSRSRDRSPLDVGHSRKRERRSSSRERSPLDVRHSRRRERRSSSRESSPLDVRHSRGRERRSSSRESSPLDVGHSRGRERRSSSRESSPLDVGHSRRRERRSSSRETSPLDVEHHKKRERRSSSREECSPVRKMYYRGMEAVEELEFKNNEGYFDYLSNFEIEDDEDASYIQRIIQNCTSALLEFRQELSKGGPQATRPLGEVPESQTGRLEDSGSLRSRTALSKEIPVPAPVVAPTPAPKIVPLPGVSVSGMNPSAGLRPSALPAMNPSALPGLNPSVVNPSAVPGLRPSALPGMNVSGLNPTMFPGVNPHRLPSVGRALPAVNSCLFPSVNPSTFPAVNPPLMPNLNPSPLPVSKPIGISSPNPVLVSAPKSSLDLLPKSLATEIFFDSIKNMDESDVITAFRNIAAANPAFRGIDIPSIIGCLRAAGRLKSS